MTDSKENVLESSENLQQASVASISQTKELLSQEIESIEKSINEIDEAKQKSIDVIESKKRLLLEQIDTEDAPEAHRQALQELALTEREIEARRESITLLDETIAQLDLQLAEIQAQYDRAIAELEAKKQHMKQQLAYYNELDARVSKLSELIGHENDTYETKLSSLLDERDQLLKRTDLSETTLQAKLKELDDLIADYGKMHEASLKSLNKLLSQIVAESTAERGEVGLEEAYVEEPLFTRDIEGEIEVTDQEQVRPELLGFEEELHYPTEQEYSARGELGALESSKLGEEYHSKEFQYSLKSSYVTSPREQSELEGEASEEKYPRLSQDRAFREFLICQEQITSPTTTTTSSESSKIELTSRDVEYLKATFGKSLTLALAEITAVQPKDPVHYLAHWLMKYRYNDEARYVEEKEHLELLVERDRLAAILREQECKEVVEYTIEYLLNQVQIKVLEERLAKIALMNYLTEEGEDEEADNVY